MSSAEKNLSEYKLEHIENLSSFQFGIIVADWNSKITHSLLEGCKSTLISEGVLEEHISILHVPGSFELVAGAQALANDQNLDAYICIGCVIKGETKHDDYINLAVSKGLMDLTLKFNKPFIFGVLTPNSMQQALDRAGGAHGNKGVEAASTAIQMAAIYQRF